MNQIIEDQCLMMKYSLDKVIENLCISDAVKVYIKSNELIIQFSKDCNKKIIDDVYNYIERFCNCFTLANIDITQFNDKSILSMWRKDG